MKTIWQPSILKETGVFLSYVDIPTIRGAFTESFRFSKRFSNFDCKSISEVKSLESLDCYENIFLTSQIQHFYSKYNQIKIISECFAFVRPEEITRVKYSLTNGYSVFKSNPSYYGFFPMLYRPEYQIEEVESEVPVIGYYHRPARDDFVRIFRQFVKSIIRPIKLLIMNKGNKPILYNPNILDIEYTNNPKDFWSKVTHYFYALDDFMDPWPTTLQEAVNFNKQIIIQGDTEFEDGKKISYLV